MRKILSDFINLFFPNICLGCGKRLIEGESYICLSCIGNIPATDYHLMRGNKLEERFAGRFLFDRIASYAVFTKGGVIQSLIHELKYNNNPHIGIFIGVLAANHTLQSSFFSGIDFLVPVPLHPKREKERGYNQSLKIAEGISQVTGIPVYKDNLVRVINNPSQTTQNQSERWKNTENIFDLVNIEELYQKHILLIDDTITTGSTLESCAKTILNKADSCRISIYSIGASLA
ncbi:MAG: ComF family protein [Dysgonomonas sp.]